MGDIFNKNKPVFSKFVFDIFLFQDTLFPPQEPNVVSALCLLADFVYTESLFSFFHYMINHWTVHCVCVPSLSDEHCEVYGANVNITVHVYYGVKKSETRMTASVPKTRLKYVKGSKECCLLGQNTTCKFLG